MKTLTISTKHWLYMIPALLLIIATIFVIAEIDINFSYHPVQQIKINDDPTNFTSIDEDGDGYVDVAEMAIDANIDVATIDCTLQNLDCLGTCGDPTCELECGNANFPEFSEPKGEIIELNATQTNFPCPGQVIQIQEKRGYGYCCRA